MIHYFKVKKFNEVIIITTKMSKKLNVKIRFQKQEGMSPSETATINNASSVDFKKTEDFSIKIIITNSQLIAQRDKYSKDIKSSLDPRDREFILPFHAIFNISKFNQQIQQKSNQVKSADNIQSIPLTDSLEYSKLLNEIYDYLVEVSENVNSISFQLLSENKLRQNQVKVFASKNILINIQSVLTVFRKQLESSSIITSQQINDILVDLTEKIDQHLNFILAQLASHYPQAQSSSGENARMREALIDINRSQDDNNDFIYANKIAMYEYIPTDQNGNMSFDHDPQAYNGFVMQVINKAIKIAGETVSNQQQTVFEKFNHFSEALFYFSHRKNSQEIINRIKGKLKDYQGKKDESLRKQAVNYFLNQLSSTKMQLETHQFKQIESAQQQEIEKAKKDHRYVIAKKIPNNVKHFTKLDLKTNNFHVSSSAVLRIMTKWSESLQKIFEESDLHIRQKTYNFKDIYFNPIPLGKDRKNQLCNNLKNEYASVKKELKKMKERNTLFQSHILSENEPGSSYLRRFSEVRSASSQINTVLVEFTRKYLCLLIYHLIRAGIFVDLNPINLVGFRVCDLLRSKLQCSESTFINVLNTLTILDQSKEIEGNFKMVRIKNKLSKRDNNILINYMFLGKVQCELQLSIQEMAKKDKDYYSFSHFLYELTRGKFGVLTQCTTIVCQHDPIISSSNGTYYRPKKLQIPAQRKQLSFIHQKNQTVYKCWKCRQLTIQENLNLFLQSEDSCNSCISKEENPEKKLNDKNLKGLRAYLEENLLAKTITRAYNIGDAQEGKYILSISNQRVKDNVKLYKVWRHQREFKLFMIEMKSEVLKKIQFKNFDFSGIDYFDVQKYRQNHLKRLAYVINEAALPGIFELIKINQKQIERIQLLISYFERFRIEKNLIKQIQYKSQVLDLRDDPYKLKALNEIVAAQKEEKDNILYKKWNILDFKHIKKVDLQELKLQAMPAFIKQIRQATDIDLGFNRLKQVLFQNQTEQSIRPLINQNGEIILKQNEKLEKFSIFNNQVTAIDLSTKRKLKILCLADNKLTTVDLSNNNKLISLMLNWNNLSSAIICYSPKLFPEQNMWLGNQCSKHCEITLLHHKDEAQKCKILGEKIVEIYNQKGSKNNQYNCEYSFKMVERD